MKHRAKVIDSTGYIKDEDDFVYLCDAVAFCNNNASAGDHCLIVEVIRSLTDYEEYGTITSWYHSREYAL